MVSDRQSIDSCSSDIPIELSQSLHEPVELSDIEMEDEPIFNDSDHDQDIQLEMSYPAMSELVCTPMNSNLSVLDQIITLEEHANKIEKMCTWLTTKTKDVEEGIAKLKSSNGRKQCKEQDDIGSTDCHSQKLLEYIKGRLESNNPSLSDVVRYIDDSVKNEFKVVDPDKLAAEWGEQKGKTSITVKKLYRSFTYLVKNKKQLQKISKWRYRFIKHKSANSPMSCEDSPQSCQSTSCETTSDMTYESDCYSPMSTDLVSPPRDSPAYSPLARTSPASSRMNIACKSYPLMAICQHQSFSPESSIQESYLSRKTTPNLSISPSPHNKQTTPELQAVIQKSLMALSPINMKSPTEDTEHSFTPTTNYAPPTMLEISQESSSLISTTCLTSCTDKPVETQINSEATLSSGDVALHANHDHKSYITSISPDSYCMNPSLITSVNSQTFNIDYEESMANIPYENIDATLNEELKVGSFLSFLMESSTPLPTSTEMALPQRESLNTGIRFGTGKNVRVSEYLDLDSLSFMPPTPTFSNYTDNPVDNLITPTFNSSERFDVLC